MVNVGLRGASAFENGRGLRSWLIVSAVAPPALETAHSSGASALVLRIDDASARAQAVTSLKNAQKNARGAARPPLIFLEFAGDAGEAGLDAIVAAAPAGVFLHGCESRADIQRLSARLAVCEAEAGLQEGTVRIVAWAAQTPKGALGLAGLADASPRLAGLAFDAEALGAALGAPSDSPTVRAVQAHVIIAAAAAGVAALVHAPAGDAAACARAKRAGFTGMIARSPDQIAGIESVFESAD